MRHRNGESRNREWIINRWMTAQAPTFEIQYRKCRMYTVLLYENYDYFCYI